MLVRIIKISSLLLRINIINALKMPALKYGQIPAPSKEFNNHEEVTDLTNNDLNHNMMAANLIQ